jgi:hypothetical protein
MADNKKIIIQVELQDDGTVNLKKLQKALDDVNKSQKAGIKVTEEKTKALKGTEAALLAEIRALKADRAANANTIPAYQKATVAITKVEDKLRKLTEARNKDVQVNAQFISNQGLASNSIVEFGRLISDAPFGIIGMTNNISQLGSQLGTLSRKTGSARASFDILIKQLKSGGALILGFQILISLITLYRDEITDFIKGTNTAAGKLKQLREEIEETNKTLDAEGVKLMLLNTVINDNTASRDAQIAAAVELASVLPNLTAEEIRNKESIESTSLAIEKYITQQKLRAERDALIDANADVFFKKAKLRQIGEIEDDEERAKAFEKFVKDNDSFLLRYRAAIDNFSAESNQDVYENPYIGIRAAIFGSSEEEGKQVLNTIIKDTDEAAALVLDLLDDIQKQIDTVVDDDDPKGDKRDKVANFVFGEGWAGRVGKTNEEIVLMLKKIQDRIFDGTGIKTFKEQLQDMKDSAKKVTDDMMNDESIKNAIAEKEKDDLKQRMFEKEIKRTEDRKKAEEKLAQMLMTQVKKLASIQSQAFQGTITRLNSERDIILNNDNLTASEKDRLLKENDKKSRAVKIQQIKFQRDMFQIEAAMEIAKLTMAANSAIFNIGASAAKSTVDATTSIGKFLQDLGPIAGPIAFGAMIGGVLAQISSARKKANQQIKALSGPLAGVNSGGSGGGSAPIQAPAFNVVGATQESQLAQTIAGSEEKPLRAYVVASDVSTAQELERSTIEGASIG